MHPPAGFGAANPLAGAIAEGRAAIGPHGPLEDGPGPARGQAVQEGAVEAAGFGFAHPLDHGDAGRLQLGDAAPCHLGVGIGHGDHHLLEACRDHRLAAGWGAAVVAAGLERHHQGAAAGPIPRLA